MMGTQARLAILSLLLMAFWNPTVPIGRAPQDVIVLVDESVSVDRQIELERWHRVVARLATLPTGSRLSLIRFATAPVVELRDVPIVDLGAGANDGPPQSRVIDRTRTDLEKALNEGLTMIGDERPTTIVLLTDGVQTDGDAAGALRALKARGIPVVVAEVSPARAAGDCWIQALRAPRSARAGDVVRIVATVGGPEGAQAAVRVRVNGEVRAGRSLRGLGRPQQVDFDVPVRAAGLQRVAVTVECEGDGRSENDAREILLQVDGLPRIDYVTTRAEPSTLLRSLRLGAWDVAQLPPADFERSLVDSNPALVVLDDVAIDDMAATAWQRLDALVRNDGAGLLVLGGPHSFGAGGYRDSILEGLLPVTSEGRDLGSRAAILFMVDTSGSMARDRSGRDRVALARRAIAETLSTVPEADLVGLSSFALEPQEIVPLGVRHGSIAAFVTQLPEASGGTRLRPALEQAIDRLTQAPVRQRLLVLVTDGFVEGEDLAPVEQRIAAADIAVIALAVGADVELAPLRGLTASGGGALLQVDEVATLPSLMRREVAMRRQAAEIGTTRLRASSPSPFAVDAGGGWPPVSGYMVARARPGSATYLESERGDPLFASSVADAGRTAVLTAGLGTWAEEWPHWRGWGGFAGGLAQWLAHPADDARLYGRIEDRPEGLALDVDALGEDGGWTTSSIAFASAVDPWGRARSVELTATAPGHFEGMLPAPVPGVYTVTFRAGDRVRVDHVIRSADRELATGPPSKDLKEWEAAGLLASWRGDELPHALHAPPRRRSIRPWAVILAAIAYAMLVVYEERGARLRTSSWDA